MPGSLRLVGSTEIASTFFAASAPVKVTVYGKAPVLLPGPPFTATLPAPMFDSACSAAWTVAGDALEAIGAVVCGAELAGLTKLSV